MSLHRRIPTFVGVAPEPSLKCRRFGAQAPRDRRMDYVKRTVGAIWPETALDNPAWLREWESGHRRRFVKTARIFFPIAAVGYMAHFFFFDVPNELEPIEYWFVFRTSCALLSLSCLALYFSPYAMRSWSRWPAIFVMAVGCHLQAQVTLYYPEAPWIYPYVFVFACVLVLQMSPAKSLLFALLLFATFFPPLLNANIHVTHLVSATFATAVISFTTRASYSTEILSFIATKQRDESRQQIIDLQEEFSDRLRSFIPSVISERIETLIQTSHMNPLEASIDVLTARKRNVACLFSDIRGFTKGSHDLETFLLESAIPEIKASSDAVEHYSGIPRKVGDLIFAYFDSDDRDLNILQSIMAALTLSRLNKDLNDTSASTEVNRYILVSSGDAIVGNVGGLNSSIEITALGPPVNFLSRLDDVTKEPGLACKLKAGDILLSDHTHSRLLYHCPNASTSCVNLRDLNIEVRDFPEVQFVHILQPTPSNFHSISSAYSDSTSSDSTS